MTTTRPRPQVMTLTDAAAARVKALMSTRGDDAKGLKIGVKKGGCAGMEYTMAIVGEIGKFDEVVEAAGVESFIPVTLSHAGWVGIELGRRLGAARVPKIVHLDWIVLPPPPEYMGLVHGLAAPESWEQMRDILFNIWLEGVDDPKLISFVRDEMGGYDGEMWMRSGREIGACIENGVSALQALSQIEPPVPALHVYAQPPDEGYYQAQAQFAQANPWFHIHRLPAHSHFPTFELVDEIAQTIEDFVRQDA